MSNRKNDKLLWKIKKIKKKYVKDHFKGETNFFFEESTFHNVKAKS